MIQSVQNGNYSKVKLKPQTLEQFYQAPCSEVPNITEIISYSLNYMSHFGGYL